MTIISIGAFCITAEILKRGGHRKASYPFDWLFCSVAATIGIIQSDFAYFLDPKFLTPLRNPDGQDRCIHSLYDENDPTRFWRNRKFASAPRSGPSPFMSMIC